MIRNNQARTFVPGSYRLKFWNARSSVSWSKSSAACSSWVRRSAIRNSMCRCGATSAVKTSPSAGAASVQVGMGNQFKHDHQECEACERDDGERPAALLARERHEAILRCGLLSQLVAVPY